VVDDAEKLIARTPETFKEKQNIDARILHEVREIDLKQRRLRVKKTDTGQTTWEPFEQLLVSTGSISIRPDVPGIDAKGIYGVNTLQSGLNVRRVVDEQQPQKAVIIGGGYIGLEMAEALIMRKLEVSLVERSEQVMNTLDSDMGELVSEALMKVGVKLYRNESLTAFETDNGSVQAVVTDQRTLPTDLVILGMGVQPNTGLAQDAGIPLGVKGAIKVNDLMQTEIEGIWAAGDCAECYHLMRRQPFHIALGTVANKMGRVAGINIGGGYATFPGIVGTAVSKICDVEVARTGLQEKEVQDLGLQYVTGKIESSTRAGYYPDSGRIHVKLLAEKGTGRLLGGQIVGKEGAAKRIDVLATALHAELTLDAMINLDLSYAPPYSPVWDPIIIAARVAVKKL